VAGTVACRYADRGSPFGVRMALGATVRDVMTLVLRQCLRMAFTGIGLGIVAAMAAGHALQRLVQGIQPVEVATFAVMAILLLAAAVVAGFVPAPRKPSRSSHGTASRVDLPRLSAILRTFRSDVPGHRVDKSDVLENEVSGL
jgi:hypothetical protein